MTRGRCRPDTWSCHRDSSPRRWRSSGRRASARPARPGRAGTARRRRGGCHAPSSRPRSGPADHTRRRHPGALRRHIDEGPQRSVGRQMDEAPVGGQQPAIVVMHRRDGADGPRNRVRPNGKADCHRRRPGRGTTTGQDVDAHQLVAARVPTRAFAGGLCSVVTGSPSYPHRTRNSMFSLLPEPARPGWATRSGRAAPVGSDGVGSRRLKAAFTSELFRYRMMMNGRIDSPRPMPLPGYSRK